MQSQILLRNKMFCSISNLMKTQSKIQCLYKLTFTTQRIVSFVINIVARVHTVYLKGMD